AGLCVLLAAIEGTRAERVRETALLRALGARSGLIVRGLIAEYAVLGGLAGLVAAIAAQTVAWVLAEQVFQIPYGPRPLLWLIGTLAGAGIVALLGWISLRPTLGTPPKTVLQQGCGGRRPLEGGKIPAPSGRLAAFPSPVKRNTHGVL